jgi:hypothetical protein
MKRRFPVAEREIAATTLLAVLPGSILPARPTGNRKVRERGS